MAVHGNAVAQDEGGAVPTASLKRIKSLKKTAPDSPRAFMSFSHLAVCFIPVRVYKLVCSHGKP